MSRLIAPAAFVLILLGGELLTKHLIAPPPAASDAAVESHGDTEVTSFGCGVERWSVKTGVDTDAGKIRLNTTVWASPHSLGSLPAPASLSSDSRIAPVEDTVYRESVTLVQFKEEADSDIHLVIAGTSGRTMIAEIPSPTCVQANSPLRSRIVAARAAFTAHFGALSGTWHTVNAPIRLTGVGFYDRLHGASGAAPDGVELHAVLSISFP